MAQSRKKRKTKHRGNAVGMVEARGRTGRKPTSAERSGSRSSGAKGTTSAARPHRLDRPPTWKGALFRAVAASGTFFGFLVLFFDRPTGPSAVISIAMIAFYTPLGYVTDLWIHRRRQARRAREESG